MAICDVTLESPSHKVQAILGETIKLKATVTDETGTPVDRQLVCFKVCTLGNGYTCEEGKDETGWEQFGCDYTGSWGIARQEYTPTKLGIHRFYAYTYGLSAYGPCQYRRTPILEIEVVEEPKPPKTSQVHLTGTVLDAETELPLDCEIEIDGYLQQVVNGVIDHTWEIPYGIYDFFVNKEGYYSRVFNDRDLRTETYTEDLATIRLVKIVPTKPNPDLKIDEVIIIDSKLGEFNVYPEGEVPNFTPAGYTRARVIVSNLGKSGQCYLRYQVNGSVIGEDFWIGAGTTKKIFLSRIYSNPYAAILKGIIRGGWLSDTTIENETTRQEFDMYTAKAATTYPHPNPDIWTDSLEAVEGKWITPIDLDLERMYGDVSIKYVSSKNENSGNVTFQLNDGWEADANKYPWFHLIISLRDNCSGPFRIVFEDILGNRVSVSLVAELATWEIFAVPVGIDNDWLWSKDPANTKAFDWTKIKKITVISYFQAPTLGIFHLDFMHFTSEVPGRRNIYVGVYIAGKTPPTPVVDANVIHGMFVGLDPSTGKETYIWNYDKIQKTDQAGEAVFSGLWPLIYGIRVEDPSGLLQTTESGRVDVRGGDRNVYIWMPIKKEEACFIATVAYGSPLASQLNTLRRFRNRYLPKQIISLYYFVSPTIAFFIGKHKQIRALTRKLLNFTIKILGRNGNAN